MIWSTRFISPNVFMTIAFYLPGNIPIYAYSLLLGSGATLALIWVAFQSQPADSLKWVRAGVWVLFGMFLGSRLAYVGVHWPYFQNHLGEIAQGGLAWPGAVLGGMGALFCLAWVGAYDVRQTADALFPLVVSITLLSWLACWVDGCAYGQRTEAWYAFWVQNEWGIFEQRWPLQLIAATSALILGGGIDIFRIRSPRIRAWMRTPGQKAGFGLLLFSIHGWFFSLLRADPAPLWHGWRLDTWFGLGFIVFSGVVFGLLWRTKPPLLQNRDT